MLTVRRHSSSPGAQATSSRGVSALSYRVGRYTLQGTRPLHFFVCCAVAPSSLAPKQSWMISLPRPSRKTAAGNLHYATLPARATIPSPRASQALSCFLLLSPRFPPHLPFRSLHFPNVLLPPSRSFLPYLPSFPFSFLSLVCLPLLLTPRVLDAPTLSRLFVLCHRVSRYYYLHYFNAKRLTDCRLLTLTMAPFCLPVPTMDCYGAVS